MALMESEDVELFFCCFLAFFFESCRCFLVFLPILAAYCYSGEYSLNNEQCHLETPPPPPPPPSCFPPPHPGSSIHDARAADPGRSA
jgi:hypothetical protein